MNTQFASLFDNVANKEALYCLKDYSSVKVKNDKEDASMHTLQISFEVCKTSTACTNLAIRYLEQYSFWFPYQNSFFFPSNHAAKHNSLLQKLDQDFVYPYIAG